VRDLVDLQASPKKVSSREDVPRLGQQDQNFDGGLFTQAFTQVTPNQNGTCRLLNLLKIVKRLKNETTKPTKNLNPYRRPH